MTTSPADRTRSAVDLVIVNRDGGDRLRRGLAGLAAADAWLDLRVVVVDNASTDGSTDALPRLRHGPSLIQHATDPGVARAYNRGAALGTAPTLLFLPEIVAADDPEALAANLTAALAAARADDAVGAVSAGPEAGGVPPGPGAFLLVRRALFDQLAGFDERFESPFAEADLCARIRAAGRRVRPAAVLRDAETPARAASAQGLFRHLGGEIRYTAVHGGGLRAAQRLAAILALRLPRRLAGCLARRAMPEARQVLAAAGLLLRASPALLRTPRRPD